MGLLLQVLISNISLCSDCASDLSADVPQLANMMEANISLYDKHGELLISSGDKIDVPAKIADLKENPFSDMPSAFYARIVDVDKVPVVRSYAILKDINDNQVYIIMSSKAEIVKLERNLALFFVLVLLVSCDERFVSWKEYNEDWIVGITVGKNLKVAKP